jgi:hypothetical protein
MEQKSSAFPIDDCEMHFVNLFTCCERSVLSVMRTATGELRAICPASARARGNTSSCE